METVTKALPAKGKRSLPPGRVVGAAQAKTHFLSLIDEVERNGSVLTVTRRGKAVVHVIPVEKKPKDVFGCMKGTAKAVGDIVGPEPDIWEAMS